MIVPTDSPIAPASVERHTVAELGEHALIERITARLAMPSWVVVGPGEMQRFARTGWRSRPTAG
jgi:hypothetical protein